MELEWVKKYFEYESKSLSVVDDAMTSKFVEPLIVTSLRVDLIEPGRAAAIPTAGYSSDSGVSVKINVSYFDAVYLNEEIEIEGRVLSVGKTVAVVSVEFRKKKSGKVFAQGRHTKYLAVASKM